MKDFPFIKIFIITFITSVLTLIFISTRPQLIREYRVTYKKWAYELFDSIDKDETCKIIRIKNLDDLEDGQLLIIYDYYKK